MKTFSIVKTPLFTLILAFMLVGTIGISAAVKKDNVKKVEKVVVTQTWYFTGAVNNNHTNPDNYSPNPPGGLPCDDLPEEICQIVAPDNGGKPDMSASVPGKPGETVSSQINDAYNSLIDEEREPTLNETVQAFRSN